MARLSFDEYVIKGAILLFLIVLFLVIMIPVQILWFIPFYLLHKKMIEKDYNNMTPMEWFGKFAVGALNPNN